MEPLGQIAKRLQIIKTAITMTDDETINMQRSKLRLHKGDKALDNILDVLNDESYAQASSLIEQYLQGSFMGEYKVMPQASSIHTERELELIKKFGLFVETTDSDPYNPISEDEMLNMSRSVATKAKEEEAPPAEYVADEVIVEDSAVDDDDTTPTKAELDDSDETTQQEHNALIEEAAKELESLAKERTNKETKEKLIEAKPISSVEATQEIEEPIEDEGPKVYPPISYIDQQLKNMRYKYPQVQESSERFESEVNFLHMISIKGYTETDIEETISYVYMLQDEDRLAEASHLLLICAATESIYAQFILARELYKGEIVKKDIDEAFTQINRIATNKCPEAICDLAQFYEHGIGTTRDRKKAFGLYRDAKRLGLKRAIGHIERLEEDYNGIFGKLFGGTN